MSAIVAAVLAGGQSQRMGRDKTEIMWQGATLLARTARVAQETGCSVMVVGREQPDTWVMKAVKFVPDAFRGQGPLGGLATALQTAESSVLLLACDMPRLTPEALDWLMRQETGTHGSAVRQGDRWEPLFSLYTPDVLPLVQERLAAGKRSLQSLINAGEFRAAPAPPWLAAALVNVNTPEELAQL